MSLKAFHLVFIALSVLLAVGSAVWAWLGYLHGGGPALLLLAMLSMSAGGALVIYAVNFWKKVSRLGS